MLREVEYSECQQECIKVKLSHVIDPDVSYVSYKIFLETNDLSFTFQRSTTCRRYSEFRLLHTMLTKQFPFVKLPSCPPKSPFKKTFDISFIEKREAALQEYLEQLCLMKVCLSSRAFHLFVQSCMSMVEIKNIVTGEITYVEEALSLANTLKSFITRRQPIIDGEVILNQNGNCSEVSSADLISKTSSPGSKRVSFCDQVTVAEIHAP